MNYKKLTLLLISGLTIMAAATVAPSLAEIAIEFGHIPNAELLSKLVLSLPAVFIAATAPFAGRLTDKYGRIRLLVVGLLLYAIGGSTGFYLDNLYSILAGRAVLGFSVGILTTVTITLIGDYFKGTERMQFIGFQTTYIAAIGILFLTGAGFLADINWRYPFLIYCFAFFLVPLSTRFLHEPDTTPAPSEVGEPLRISAMLKILFGTGFLLMLLFYIIPTQLPFVLKSAGYPSTGLIGLALAVNTFGMLLSSLFFSRVLSGLSHFAVYTLGFALLGAGFVLIGSTESYPIILFAGLVAGVGVGFVWPNTNLWILEMSSNQYRGRIMGILTTCVFVGQFISPLAVQPILEVGGQTVLFKAAGIAYLGMAAFYLIGRKTLAT